MKLDSGLRKDVYKCTIHKASIPKPKYRFFRYMVFPSRVKATDKRECQPWFAQINCWWASWRLLNLQFWFINFCSWIYLGSWYLDAVFYFCGCTLVLHKFKWKISKFCPTSSASYFAALENCLNRHYRSTPLQCLVYSLRWMILNI